MQIRAYREDDWGSWLRMAKALFPEEEAHGLAEGMRAFRARRDAEVFIAERGDGSAGGFVEVGTRPYADGCDTSPVGYIEAWYVDPDLRRSGVGRAMLDAAEEWARGQGYTEMASDALLDNTVSHRAHIGSGYAEIDRVVQFRKPLGPAGPVANGSIGAESAWTVYPTATEAPYAFGFAGGDRSVRERLETVRAYLATIESGATGDALARCFTDDVEQIEYPNRLVPQGATRALGDLLEGAIRGQRVLRAQRYEVRGAVVSGNTVAIEALWVGTLAVPIGARAAGEEMRAHFGVFIELCDGRIVRQRNYDCFDAF